MNQINSGHIGVFLMNTHTSPLYDDLTEQVVNTLHINLNTAIRRVLGRMLEDNLNTSLTLQGLWMER